MKKLLLKLRTYRYCCGYVRVDLGVCDYYIKHKQSNKCLALGKCRRDIAEEKLNKLMENKHVRSTKD